MTAKFRQQSRAVLRAAALALALAAGILAAHAATTERIVVDRHTGLAINGFDPVAYFTDAAARAGSENFEHSAFGATWRFRNEGNMAAFAADPQVYSPQYGGYDPVGVARGVAAPGHPQLWVIREHKLYLFYTDDARMAFTANPEEVLDAAEDKWPEVLRTLVP